MSLKRHGEALLCGYQPPLFPDSIVRLVALVSGMDGLGLRTVCERIPGYAGFQVRMETSDGYFWYRSLYFGDGQAICLAFPWHQDWAKADGYQTDRSPAVYLKDPLASLAEVDAVIELLAAKLFESRYKPDKRAKKVTPYDFGP